MVAILSQLRTQRILVVNDTRVVDGEYNLTLRKVAGCENTHAVDVGVCYDYVDHGFIFRISNQYSYSLTTRV